MIGIAKKAGSTEPLELPNLRTPYLSLPTKPSWSRNRAGLASLLFLFLNVCRLVDTRRSNPTSTGQIRKCRKELVATAQKGPKCPTQRFTIYDISNHTVLEAELYLNYQCHASCIKGCLGRSAITIYDPDSSFMFGGLIPSTCSSLEAGLRRLNDGVNFF
jgi:hypothetical protein